MLRTRHPHSSSVPSGTAVAGVLIPSSDLIRFPAIIVHTHTYMQAKRHTYKITKKKIIIVIVILKEKGQGRKETFERDLGKRKIPGVGVLRAKVGFPGNKNQNVLAGEVAGKGEG